MRTGRFNKDRTTTWRPLTISMYTIVNVEPFKGYFYHPILKKVSWRHRTDALCCDSKRDISSNFGLRPRQFHCIILCLKSIRGKIDKNNKYTKRMETFMIYLVSYSYLLISVLDVLSTYSSASIWSEFVKLANLLAVFTELSGTLVFFMFLSFYYFREIDCFFLH